MSEMLRIIKKIFIISRFHVAFQSLAFLGVGLFIASNKKIDLTIELIVAFIIVFLIVSFGFVINDFFDYKVDIINKPNHPVPSGVITLKEVKVIAIFYIVIIVLFSLFMEDILRIFCIINLFITYLYSAKLKNIPILGNLSVAYLNASIFLFSGFIVENIGNLVFFSFFVVFIYTGIQEVIYTLRDVDADRKAGYKTVATIYGSKFSLGLIIFLYILYFLSSIVLLLWKEIDLLFLVAFFTFSILPLGFWIKRLISSQSPLELIASRIKIIRGLSIIPLIILGLNFGVN